jgi:hypothetical protein
MEGIHALNRQELQGLRDLNVELLHANLEMLREVKDYCRKNRLPSPALDEALSFRVQQVIDLTDAINEIASPDAGQPRKSPDYGTQPSTARVGGHRRRRRM